MTCWKTGSTLSEKWSTMSSSSITMQRKGISLFVPECKSVLNPKTKLEMRNKNGDRIGVDFCKQTRPSAKSRERSSETISLKSYTTRTLI
eukprot:gene3631-2204_t